MSSLVPKRGLVVICSVPFVKTRAIVELIIQIAPLRDLAMCMMDDCRNKKSGYLKGTFSPDTLKRDMTPELNDALYCKTRIKCKVAPNEMVLACVMFVIFVKFKTCESFAKGAVDPVMATKSDEQCKRKQYVSLTKDASPGTAEQWSGGTGEKTWPHS